MSDVDELTRVAAHALGMKYSEIAGVEKQKSGALTVTTHDGQVSELRLTGGTTAAGDPVASADAVDEADEKPAEPEKPKPRAKRS